ncbi:MAG: 2Fe-2S iron-sulfur cluster-binding protein [Novosphingobium sp.]|nr:2Fe-2S iron-sulfur cluster-binding protein [Novosphingobium sp.]
MAQITFIEHNGTRHTVEVPEGLSLMQGAVSHNVPGIDADCGGALTCGTCLVIVTAASAALVGPCSEHERQMLEMTVGDHPNARLSCQIVVSAEMNGLAVELPESQG